MTGDPGNGAVTAALVNVEARLAATAAMLANGVAVDLAGLEDEIRSLCILAGGLDAVDRPAAIARLGDLLHVLETMESALVAARVP